MNTTVIYHSADFDGLFCREIAKKFLPDAELIGWDWGQPLILFPDEGLVYIMDLSPDCIANPETAMDESRVIWIDHHKSAIDKWSSRIPGFRIDGVAACRLAWQWFLETVTKGLTEFSHTSWTGASKDNFINRTVSEPYAVQLAGEYDIWDKRNPDAETFQFALRSMDLSSYHWDELLSLGLEEMPGGERVTHSEAMVASLLKDGRLLQRYQQSNDKGMMGRSFIIEWEGLKFLALTTARCNSLTFAAKDVPETGHDALMGIYWNGKVWNASLYHAKHRTDLDLSKIAEAHGGGGHRGACGFSTTKLSFMP